MINVFKNRQNYSIGIFADGNFLQLVCLEKNEQNVRLISAQNIILPESILIAEQNQLIERELAPDQIYETTPVHIPPELDGIKLITKEEDLEGLPQQATMPDFLDISSGINNPEIDSAAIEQSKSSILQQILNNFGDKKYNIAITLAQPQIYYAYFDTDWGLRGKKLKQKIIDELWKEKPHSEKIEQDSIHIIKLKNNSFMAILRDNNVAVIQQLQLLKNSLYKRLLPIALVESAEISLVNLIKKNYTFKEDEISVIVYIGNEISRLLFMEGDTLCHISPIIGEGADSFNDFNYSPANLADTIRSRLLLEQDRLIFSKINRILLTGGASSKEFTTHFINGVEEKINVEPINLTKLKIDKSIKADVFDFTVPIGAAWRALEKSENNCYAVDLTPFKIKEDQKVLKLGMLGWTLFLLIPLLTFIITLKISQMNHHIKQLNFQSKQNSAELTQLQEINAKVDIERARYSSYISTYGILDSMLIGTATWSDFLNQISEESKTVGNIWITEMETINQNFVSLKGYSTKRECIPSFVDTLGSAVLRQVQVQNLGNRIIYHFDIEIKVPDISSVAVEPASETETSLTNKLASNQ